MADQDPAALATETTAQLLSLAVHEFRTPVSVVGGYLRMLQRDAETPMAARHRKMVEEAEKSCARLVALIGEMNEVAKLDAAATPLARETFDLFHVVRDVADETHEADDRGVRLKVRGATSGAVMAGDAVRLHHAFGAFFRSVLREQPDGATVMIDCRLVRDGNHPSALVAVARDEELATAEAAVPSPFDDQRGGLGLTLPIARRVIERHGGRVWSPPGNKSEFGARSAVCVSIPLG